MAAELRDILISRGQLEKFFDKRVPVTLWRAFDSKEMKHPMQLVETEIVRRSGKRRPPDITIELQNGQPWVFVENRPRGLSTWNKKVEFKAAHWKYYLIPAGTPLPPGLVVVEDNYNPDYDAVHHTLAPERDMPLATFRALLMDLFARMRQEAV